MDTLLSGLINPIEVTGNGRDDARYAPVPAMTADQLLQLHTELTEHAEFIPSGAKTALEGAGMLRTVIRNLHGGSDAPVGIAVGSAPHYVVFNVVAALRLNPTRFGEIGRHLDLAQGWVNDLLIRAEAAKAKSAADKGSDPWGVEPC
ncbi:hypothetical protein [Amycolatopsis sp. NBC_01286]|uniref:hypothetical protein n=1 Tax=Amycolatopsis sp. NBC_01286 TaxID=2903560 RepID=UPI002E0DC70C|nr:hypothetical protein OG570_48155 [Amycolatopsis sp. NBC_01286]